MRRITSIVTVLLAALVVLAATAISSPIYDADIGGYAVSSGGATGYIIQNPISSVTLPSNSVAVFDLDTDPSAGLWLHIDLGANYNDPLASSGSGGGGRQSPRSPPTPPRRPRGRPRGRGLGARVAIRSVSVEVWPAGGVDCSVYGTAGRLLLYEHFRARVVVEASVLGRGPVRGARLNLTVPAAGWYVFSRWPGPRLGNESYSASVWVNSSGRHVFWLPLNCSESWRSVETGLWVFAVQYSWSNGRESGGGVAEASVLVEGANETRVELFWLPVGTDDFYLVAFYRWSDGSLVLNRSYLLGWVGGERFSIGLWGGLWRDIAGNFTQPLYTSVSEVLGFEPPGDAAISFARVHTWDVRLSGLGENATYHCRFRDKFPSVTVRVAELSTPVYALNWTAERVWGRLKLVDWARVTPVKGWVALLVSDPSGTRSLWVPAEPFADFDFAVEEPYEVWAIPVAYGRNAIYVSDKYRVLLVKQPP